jgi:phage shock protein A
LASDRLAALEKEYGRQKEQTAKLQRSLRDLEDKLRQARHKRTLLLARLAGAESERKIGQALDRAGGAAASDSAFGQFRRLEAKVERTETMTEAYARLDGRDPDADELERRFAAQERSERLEAEFQALRQRVAEGGDGHDAAKAGASTAQ